MARATLAALIEQVRTLTGADAVTFDDDAVQEFLDRHRLDVLDLRLDVSKLPAAPGALFSAPLSGWEADATFTANGVALVLGPNPDWTGGRWEFTTQVNATVTLAGKTFDVYAASRDLILAWAAQLSRQSDFSTGGQTFSRSQRAKSLREQALEYGKRIRATSVAMVTSDAPFTEDTLRRRRRRSANR